MTASPLTAAAVVHRFVYQQAVIVTVCCQWRFLLAQHTLAGEAFTSLVLEVFRLNGRLLAVGDRLAAGGRPARARWQVLGALVDGPLTASQVARRMGLKRQSVQRLVDVLAAEGLVALDDNPDHARARLVRPTDRGRKKYAEIDEIQKQWANRTSR